MADAWDAISTPVASAPQADAWDAVSSPAETAPAQPAFSLSNDDIFQAGGRGLVNGKAFGQGVKDPGPVVSNFGAGTNAFVSDTLGAPVDLATWLINRGADAINYESRVHGGADLVGHITTPFGGSQSIKNAEAYLNASPDQIPVTGETDRLARGAGYGLASAVLPAMGAAGLPAAGNAMRTAVGAPTVGNAVIGAAAGASGTGAADAASSIVPDSWKPYVDPIAGLVGGMFGGGVTALAGSALRGVGRTAANMLTNVTDPAKQGDRLLVQAIMRDSKTPQGMADALTDAAQAGNPMFAAVDAAGRNVQRLAALAARTRGSASDDLHQFVAVRQEGQGGRYSDYLTNAVAPGNGAFATEQALVESKRAAAKPLYDEAYQAPTPTGPAYDELLSRQSVRDAMGAAERTAAEKQVPISDLFTEVPNPNAQTVTRQVPNPNAGLDGEPLSRTITETVNPTLRVPTVRGWDFIKRELDARVNQLYSAQDTTAATAVKETRDQLRTQLGDDVPAYRKALAQFADDTAAQDAVQAGRMLATSSNPDAALADVADLNPANAQLARVGFANEVQNKLDSRTTGQDKSLVFATPKMQRKVGAMYASPEARAVFEGQVGREQAMTRSNRQIAGGSNTAENLSDAEDAGLVAATRAAQGRPVAAATALVGPALIKRLTNGMGEDSARRVADYLMSADPETILRIADLYAKTKNGQAPQGELWRSPLRSGAAGVAASSFGDPTVNAIMRSAPGTLTLPAQGTSQSDPVVNAIMRTGGGANR